MDYKNDIDTFLKIAIYAAGWLGITSCSTVYYALKQRPAEINVINPNPPFKDLFTRMGTVDNITYNIPKNI